MFSQLSKRIIKLLILSLIIYSSALIPQASKAQSPTDSPSDYWAGAGDTPAMTFYEGDGRYLRFTQFPIRVYLRPNAPSIWELALEAALSEINAVLPIERASWGSEADIYIALLSPAQYARRSPCPISHQAACSLMRPQGQPNTADFRLKSRIWLQTESNLDPQHLILHELVHALGLQVHSPYPEDVLYNGTEQAANRLSPRDRNTLLRLYSAPAWGE